jgi:uncharacterized protein YciI
MFLVNMTFINMDKITPELTEQHRNYIEKEYLKNKLLFGGRKVPRTGGILISKHDNQKELELVLNNDPFILSAAVSYDIVEFIPVMASDEYKQILL